MTKQHLAFAGAAILIVGLFVPIVSMPIVGNVHLLMNGRSIPGLIILGLAVVAGFLTAAKKLPQVLWPGLAALGISLYAMGTLLTGLGDMQESIDDLADNPFGAAMAEGLITATQVQWGWLVLFAGAGLLVHVGLSNPDDGSAPTKGALSKVLIVVCALAALAPAAVNSLSYSPFTSPSSWGNETATSSRSVMSASSDVYETSAEEVAYIAQHLQLYELQARYYDSVLDGRVPGVTFKVKNNGDRTLTMVRVRVVFRDENDQPIAEEEYTPVSPYSYGGDTVLRPNYIWQNERNRFYTASQVPSEWRSGNAVASIVDIEFGPNE